MTGFAKWSHRGNSTTTVIVRHERSSRNFGNDRHEQPIDRTPVKPGRSKQPWGLWLGVLRLLIPLLLSPLDWAREAARREPRR